MAQNGSHMTNLSTLPPEVLAKICEHLLHGGPVTSHDSWADNPRISAAFLDSRSTLSRLCRVTRSLNLAATPSLYKVVLLRDRRELVCFLRTVVTVPQLRPLVRNLLWAGVLSGLGGSGTSNGTQPWLEDEEMTRAVSQHWYGTPWPPPGEADLSIVSYLRLDPGRPVRFQAFQLLAAVLAMLPQLESVFTVLGAVTAGTLPHQGMTECPELLAIFWSLGMRFNNHGQHGHPPPGRSPLPGHRPALESLRKLTLVPHPGGVRFNRICPPLLHIILPFCPRVERIELKGFNVSPDYSLGRQTVTGENVREVVLSGGRYPFQTLEYIARTFPKLRRLYTEWNDCSPARPTDASPFVALCKLAGSLEVLHMTTKRCNSWRQARADVAGPCPGLHKMTALRHLTIESPWFTEPFPSADLLKPLASFHLIDFWGTSDPANYHPRMCSTPLESLEQAVAWVYGLSSLMPNLRAFRMSSPLFRDLVLAPVGDKAVPEMRGKLVERAYRPVFADKGIEYTTGAFDPLDADSLEPFGQWAWSRIASSQLVV